MNFRKIMILMAAALTIVLISTYRLAEAETLQCNPEDIFQACDTNRDGKISKEEWDTIDTDKDDTITSEEWDKYKYKSPDNKTTPFKIKFFDVYGDGTMGKEEFLKNYKMLQ